MLNKIKLAQDLFLGLQGEGLFAGTPSIFIRTFGCNLRCDFGATKEDYDFFQKEVLNKIDQFETLDDLPLLPKMCDTFYSLYSQFNKFTVEYTVDELIEKITELSGGEFNSSVHIVITGGEPLLSKNQEFFCDLIPRLEELGVRFITIETNATQHLLENFINLIGYIEDQTDMIMSFSMSPKLSISGHSLEETCNPAAIYDYIGNVLIGPTWFKFVIDKEKDIAEIYQFMNYYKSKCSRIELDKIPIYLMARGGTKEELEKNEKIVYDLCLKHKFRYSPRLHISVAGNGIGV